MHTRRHSYERELLEVIMDLPRKYLPIIRGLSEYLQEHLRDLGIDEICKGIPLYYPNKDECFWILLRRSLLVGQSWSPGEEPTTEMKAAREALISAHREAVGASPVTLRTTSLPGNDTQRLESEWQAGWPGMTGVAKRPNATMLPGATKGDDHVQPFVIH